MKITVKTHVPPHPSPVTYHLGHPVDHPVDTPLPEGSYDKGYSTWLAAMHFLLCNNAAGLSTTKIRLHPTSPFPACRKACLSFINEARLTRLQAAPPLPASKTFLSRPSNTHHPAPAHRIFLACEYTDGITGEYTIHPATLSDASKALFQDKHAFGLTAAFNDGINHVAKQCHANNILLFVNITRGQFDPAFLHVVAHFVVMHTPSGRTQTSWTLAFPFSTSSEFPTQGGVPTTHLV
eukprot:jgi/Psemu1/29055/gm1.29055_g